MNRSYGIRIGVVKVIATLAVIFSFIRVYVYSYDHIRFENIDDMYGLPSQLKEAYFIESPPARRDISEYLLNSTIIVSDPPIGSQIFYFDNSGGVINWFKNTFTRGRWTVDPFLIVQSYGGQWKIKIIYNLCRWPDDRSLSEDSCYLASDSRRIFGISKGRVTRIGGDVFDINNRPSPPASLPTTELDADLILSMIAK